MRLEVTERLLLGVFQYNLSIYGWRLICDDDDNEWLIVTCDFDIFYSITENNNFVIANLEVDGDECTFWISDEIN